MTKAESTALWRILTILAGWDEIVAVQEVDADLDYLLTRIWPTRDPGATPDFDDDDRDQMLEALRAQIELNLSAPDVVDVAGAAEAGIT